MNLLLTLETVIFTVYENIVFGQTREIKLVVE